MTVWANADFNFRRAPILTPPIARLAELASKALEAGEASGACHIVLGDINLERDHLEFCLSQPGLTNEGRAFLLEAMSATLRSRAIAVAAACGDPFTRYTDREWAQFYHDPDGYGFASWLARNYGPGHYRLAVGP